MLEDAEDLVNIADVGGLGRLRGGTHGLVDVVGLPALGSLLGLGLELKAGGDLDSSNAPANVEKLLTIYACLNVPNAHAHFATLYNKNGEGNTWTGALKKHMAFPEMFLIGKAFWNVILPEGINYERFTALYRAALEDIDLNQRIKTMIDRTVK